jgi:D-alanyl-D-alanine carboxypeptidase/D-alanyl-D-alanine-endopeptidase (penicillin-binding protein 4)
VNAFALRRVLLAALVVLVVVACVAAPAAATLNTRITGILRDYGLSGGGTGVSVWREGATHAAYARNSRTLLAPASNMKLVTAATALYRWGADHRFKTELYLPSEPVAIPVGVVKGNVYIKGYGDPSLSTPSFQRTTFGLETSTINSFVGELRALGVTRISGHIVGDASWFDARQTVRSWTPGVKAYCGPLSGLTVNEGLNDGKRVADPPRYTARVLTNKLRAAGIDVTGGPQTGRTPDGSYLAVTLLSAPLSDLVKHMDKESDNFFAEMMMKGLGRDFRAEGSTVAGLRVATATLDKLGLSRADYRLYDGSGLSYSDRFNARMAAKLLRVMTTREDFKPFYASLSVAGVDGTLEKRMRGTAAYRNFRGKTGTLRISSCLSGYVTNAAGRRVVVSMLMNGGAVNVWAAHRAQDAIAVELAKSRL